MAVIFPGRLLFLFHSRTASRATRDLLVRLGGRDLAGLTYHHAAAHAPDGELIACTVRDPVQYVAAWYRYVQAPGYRETPPPFDSLADFTRRFENSDFERRGRLFYHARQADRLLRFDRLAADLAELLDDTGIGYQEAPGEIVLPHVGEHYHPPPPADFDTACAIRHRWHRDLLTYRGTRPTA